MKVLASITLAGLFATSSLSAQDNVMTNTETMPKLRQSTIEINPLALALSLTPSVGAIAGSYEQYLGDKWAGYISAGYGDAELEQEWVQEAREDSNGAVFDRGFASFYELGARYYEDPIGDSFYGTAGISYSETQSTFVLDEAEIRNRTYAVTPSVGAGYRWAWNSGFIVRAAIGAGFPFLNGEQVTSNDATPAAQEGIRDVEDINDQDVIPRIDFGLGYTF